MKRARHERGTEMNWILCGWCFFFSLFSLSAALTYTVRPRRSISFAPSLSLSLSLTCSLYFPCWKTGVGDSSLCPVKSLFHNMMRTMCLWLGLRGTDWEIEAGLCSSPLGSLKIGLHPWNHFKEFCTLIKKGFMQTLNNTGDCAMLCLDM